MLRTYAEDLQSDAFNPEEYVERLAWRLTGSTSSCSLDASYLASAMEEEVSNLQILFDQCTTKVEGLENQRREEEESYYASLEKLLAANEISRRLLPRTPLAASAKVAELSEKVSSVSARIVHLGDQLQSVTGPRARAYEAFKLMTHFNEFLSDQPLESDTFTDPDKLVEAGDVVQKLQMIAAELPKEKYEAVQSRIAYKYDEVEKMLIEEFVRYHHANAKNKMKQVAHVLSQFKGYGQCIDAFIDQCQWQTYRSDDMFNEIWLLLKKNDAIISEVFPNPQQVMSKLILSIFGGKLRDEVDKKLSATADMETYLTSLCDLYQKTKKLVDQLFTLNNCPDKDFRTVLVDTVFSKYLADYIKKETVYLREQCKFALQKFYDSKGHTKKTGFSGIQARLSLESRCNESLLSEEVAINILQETKQAFYRCSLLSSMVSMVENVRQILSILTQYLCHEHVEYAIDVALSAVPTQEGHGSTDFAFLNLLRQAAAISHLFERQIDDSVVPLLQSCPEGENCLKDARRLMTAVETKLDKGLDKVLTAIVNHVRFILSSEQKRQDFKPEDNDQYGAIPSCSNACTLVCKYLTQQINSLSDCLDGCNLMNTLSELVVRFHRVIVDHIYQFQYNSQGAVHLLCDVSEYRKIVSGIGVPLAKRLFDTLHALSNLLIVAPDHLLSACTSNVLVRRLTIVAPLKGAFVVLQENFDRSVVVAFVQLRFGELERMGTMSMSNDGCRERSPVCTYFRRSHIASVNRAPRANRIFDATCASLSTMSKYLFSLLDRWRLLPLICLVFYSLCGGLIFDIAEGNAALARRCNPEAVAFQPNSSFYKRHLTMRLAEILTEPVNSSKKMLLARDAWQWFTERMHVGWDACCSSTQEVVIGHRRNLTLFASLYYAVQVCTTIGKNFTFRCLLAAASGYGDVVPSTALGKLFTMAYSLLGIPLLLYILDEWGTLLMKLMFRVKYIWNAKTMGASTHHRVHTVDDVPLSLALLLQFLWLCLSAALFQSWEKDVDYFSSFYFFFISFTTIGFGKGSKFMRACYAVAAAMTPLVAGDVVPKHPLYMPLCSILVLFGLAQLSMCINLLQHKIDVTFQMLLHSVDRMYKERQSVAMDNEQRLMEKVEDVNALLKVLSEGDGIQNRFFLQALGKSRRDLVVESWERRTICRNVAVQATVELGSSSCQTVNLHRPDFKVNYLYNIDN
ncbi:Ion trans 2 and Sec10 domain containing protein [Trichuris trichiura]|uniref:Exocyst complex component 5 n=1 Tax=Trichuris trichiura TaxID=36087 RepID=A0A077YYA2_TRITR|nr:Ion trans 2 and Sec10 domain containing protein [Trichuris trichiura]